MTDKLTPSEVLLAEQMQRIFVECDLPDIAFHLRRWMPKPEPKPEPLKPCPACGIQPRSIPARSSVVCETTECMFQGVATLLSNWQKPRFYERQSILTNAGEPMNAQMP